MLTQRLTDPEILPSLGTVTVNTELRLIVTRPPEISESEEQRKVQEILLILEQLVQREDATVRFIMERLYDIGLINVMNKKVKTHPLGHIVKPLGRASRGSFRSIGTWWFQAHGPKLITDWLYTLVNLEPKKKKPAPTLELDDYPTLLPPAELEQETAHLRSQMRWLQVTLVGAIALFGSSFFWLDYNLKPAATEFLEQAASGELSVQR
ncbi:MAG: urate hydroxylase PuuD [Spirulina sp. SIO3F2]|nr:urate hydroxylase PuuD [Spirulina sp. SIO3F2]